MKNPSTQRETGEFSFTCMMAGALMKYIEARENGEMDKKNAFSGPIIETTAYDNEWGFDPKTSEGIRIINGKKIKGNSQIMKEQYKTRIENEKRAKSKNEEQR